MTVRKTSTEPEKPASSLTDSDREEISQIVAEGIAAALGGSGAKDATGEAPKPPAAPPPGDGATGREIERYVEQQVTAAVSQLRDAERAEAHDRHHAQLDEAVKERKAPTSLGKMARALFGDPG